jgi:hypothetical protein
MRRLGLGGLLLAALALSPVQADVAPRRPPRPPPSGPDRVVIRGVAVARNQHLGGNFLTRGTWLTYIAACDSSQPACNGKQLHGCSIERVDGQPLAEGDLAHLQDVDKSAGDRPIVLTLENCDVHELELAPVKAP